MKLLYATNLEDQALSFSLIENILVLRRVGLEEMVFLQTTSFQGWLDNLSSLGIGSRILAEKALSLPWILSVARREDVSLIVTNLDKKTHNPPRSSLIKGLIKRSPVPILSIDSATAPAKGLFGHIVFATDWSPASEKALTYLLGFKEIMRELDIVYVIKGKLTVKDMRELKERLAQTRKMCLDEEIDAESHVYAGKTSEEIITASKDYRASLIVLGAVSEKPTYKKIFKESSSFKIAEEAEVPVLVIP